MRTELPPPTLECEIELKIPMTLARPFLATRKGNFYVADPVDWGWRVIDVVWIGSRERELSGGNRHSVLNKSNLVNWRPNWPATGRKCVQDRVSFRVEETRRWMRWRVSLSEEPRFINYISPFFCSAMNWQTNGNFV